MKTIEEQIEEAREELYVASYVFVEIAGLAEPVVDAGRRLRERAAKRLSTLEAVRDGRMIEVYATVSVDAARSWVAFGADDAAPTSTDCLELTYHRAGSALTTLRGYATVPSDEVAEVEAES